MGHHRPRERPLSSAPHADKTRWPHRCSRRSRHTPEATPTRTTTSTSRGWSAALSRLGDLELAERLVADVSALWPYAEHALAAATAALAEADGDHQTAADGYADAAQRWEAFGVIPEQAFAHLGHGRCLLALDDPTATQPLHQARDLFTQLQAAPYVAECDTLLAQAAEQAS